MFLLPCHPPAIGGCYHTSCTTTLAAGSKVIPPFWLTCPAAASTAVTLSLGLSASHPPAKLLTHAELCWVTQKTPFPTCPSCTHTQKRFLLFIPFLATALFRSIFVSASHQPAFPSSSTSSTLSPNLHFPTAYFAQ